MRKYSEDHEWIEVEGNIATVGITNHAQEQLGDIVFVELPEEGAEFDKDDVAATVESVKSASDIFAPLSGEITEANEEIVNEPSKVNDDPENDAWFFKMTISDASELDELMSKAEYDALVG